MDEDLFHKVRNDVRLQIAEIIENNMQYGERTATSLDKVLVTLSGGALIFSMTFAEKLAPARQWLWTLIPAWVAFGVSIVAVILSTRAPQEQISKRADDLRKLSEEIEGALKEGKLPAVIATMEPGIKQVRWWNQIALWSFMIGIVLLGIFVTRNLLV